MTYILAAVIAVLVALLVDLGFLRTALVRSRRWWASYSILLVFQLLTNVRATFARQQPGGQVVGATVRGMDPPAVLVCRGELRGRVARHPGLQRQANDR